MSLRHGFFYVPRLANFLSLEVVKVKINFTLEQATKAQSGS
jgi:hypothetical protein